MTDGLLHVPLDRNLLAAHPLLRHVEVHEELPSTNDYALRVLTRREVPTPGLVVAERQTAGRGRGSNQWWSRSGSLTFSLVLDRDTDGLPTRYWPRVALLTGLALRETIALRSAEPLQVKWPNDVYLAGRKLAGVLVETAPAFPARLVIGVGVNVNNRLDDAPSELRSRATSLRDATGRCLDRASLLGDLVTRLLADLRQLVGDTFPLAERWRPSCLLTGRTITVDQGPCQLTGLCRGIDDEGALLLEAHDALHRCFAGVVTRW